MDSAEAAVAAGDVDLNVIQVRTSVQMFLYVRCIRHWLLQQAFLNLNLTGGVQQQRLT